MNGTHNNCKNCGVAVQLPYSYCYTCWKEQRPDAGNGRLLAGPMSRHAWHDDPVVDALQKLNANLGRGVQQNGAIITYLERVANSIDRMTETIEAIGSMMVEHDERKGKKRTVRKTVSEPPTPPPNGDEPAGWEEDLMTDTEPDRT